MKSRLSVIRTCKDRFIPATSFGFPISLSSAYFWTFFLSILFYALILVLACSVCLFKQHFQLQLQAQAMVSVPTLVG